MSRDLTPKEQVLVDMAMGYTKEPFVISCTYGEKTEEIVLFDPNCEMSKRYFWLSFLLDKFEDDIWPIAKENSIFACRLDAVEAHLAALVGATRTRSRQPENIPEVIEKWYNGTLDPAFYYNTYNNAAFHKWVIDTCSIWEKTGLFAADGAAICYGDIVRAKTTEVSGRDDVSPVVESVVSMHHGIPVLLYEFFDDDPYPLSSCPEKSRHIMPSTEALPYWTNRLGMVPPEYLYKRDALIL